jgi:hypothetical protein
MSNSASAAGVRQGWRRSASELDEVTGVADTGTLPAVADIRS